MEERLQFIADALSDRYTMAELCARYGVSRRVGYKWLARFAEEGSAGLSIAAGAAPCPHAIGPEVAELLCTLRGQHPDWGARKLLAVLQAAAPAPSRLAGGEHSRRSARRVAGWC